MRLVGGDLHSAVGLCFWPLQTPCAHPGLSAAVIPWFGKEKYWKLLQRYPRSAMLITITRDSGRGRVYLDGRGQMALDYTMNTADTRSMQVS